jgi:ATP-dependent RNA helicase DDX51/DBP6
LEKLQRRIEEKKKQKQLDEAATKNDSIKEEPVAVESVESDEPVKKKKNKIKEVTEDPVEQPEEMPFTILGGQKFVEPQPIEMILPYWLANPEILSSDLSVKGTDVTELKYICETLQKNLKNMKIKHLFPVQEKIMPYILNAHKKPIPFRPKDICVSAVTGSGKTLSYSVPIVQYIVDNKTESRVTALIMLPVFELATQVASVFDKLCNNLKVRCLLLTKHRDFAAEQKALIEKTIDGEFSSKVDIIISTGGRLVEHLFYTEGFDLKSLKFLIIDEADHAMSQVHNDWYHHLLQHLGITNELQSNRLSYRDLMSLVNDDGSYRLPQKLLFSATLSQDPEKMSTFNLFQPKLFTTADNKEDLIRYQERQREEEQRGQFIGKYTTPAELKEFYTITEYKLKPITLYGLIKKHNWSRFLCFTNTVETSHRLSFILQTLFGKDLVIEELSSLLPLKIRQKVLHKFSNGDVNGLICSDALSRGIDVAKIDCVISYDVPKHLKIYIHRIGRTARAGHEGTSVTLIAPDQINFFDKLIKTANKKSVQEMKPEREIEELNALNFANAQKKLRKALELEASEKSKAKSKSKGFSLFEKLQNQVKPAESVELIPESWKHENIQDTPSNGLNLNKEKKKKNLTKKKNKKVKGKQAEKSSEVSN